MSRIGVDRVLKFAFELAQSRPKKHLTSATKSNGIAITMPYWDERVDAMAKGFPTSASTAIHIDILTAHFVQRPQILRRRRREQPVRRHPERPRPGLHRHDRHRAVGQHQPDARASVAVRAGARLGARHRRAGHRQPDRPDLVRRDDARLPRPPRRARRDHRGDRDGARPGGGRAAARATSAARASTADLGRAIAEALVAARPASLLHRVRRAVKRVLHAGAGESRVRARIRIRRQPCLTLQIRNAVIVSPRRCTCCRRATPRSEFHAETPLS